MFYNSLNVRTVVNPTEWMDRMARLIGCYTHPLTLWNQPIIFMRWQICSSLPARYRLVGPGADPQRAWAWLNKAIAQHHAHENVMLSVYKFMEVFKIWDATGDIILDFRRWT